MTPVGILGLGMHLPEQVRTNDWWSADVVASWQRPRGPAPALDGFPASAREIVAAMQSQQDDPFGGTVKRHVLAEAGSIIAMQAAAARAALAEANVEASEIDLVLTCVTPTDYQLTNSACELHEALGLPRDCFTLHVDGAQHAFLLQLTLAQAMIASGQARRALLVQASAMSRLLDPKSPIAPMFGDGATAAVLGPVSAGRGLIAATHRTDGRLPNTLIASVPSKHWYDDGRAVLHLADPVGMRDILLRTVEVSKESILAALAAANIGADDVDVFAMHQGMPWLRELVQRHAGLHRARAVATVADTGHLFAAFVPATLLAARERGLLTDGDVVVMAGGGNGMTYGAAVLRWGR